MSTMPSTRASAPASPPEAATRPLLDLVSVYSNRLEDNPDFRGHKLLSARLAPPPAERAAMEGRRAYLREMCAPGDPQAMRTIVKSLLGAFPTYGATQDDASALASLAVRALDDVPTWAVSQAAARFLKSRQSIPWDPQRAPTPPQIRAEAKICMLPVEEEVARLSAVLDATLVDNETTEDERAKALAYWTQIKKQMAASNIISAPRQTEEA